MSDGDGSFFKPNRRQLRRAYVGLAIWVAIISVLVTISIKSGREEIDLLKGAYPVGVASYKDSEGVARLITFRDKTGTKYEAFDYANDGLFPDDSDGFVDKVISYKDSMRQTRRFSEELYSVMTQKFVMALEEKYSDHSLLPPEYRNKNSDVDKAHRNVPTNND